jgi:uncharacterized cupin superfamily protein
MSGGAELSEKKTIINVADVPLKDSGNGDAFVAKVGQIGRVIGSTGIGCTLVAVPPGKRAWPFHRHHVIHEMFVVLSGSGETRIGDKTYPIRAGDVIAAPAGAEAHQIINSGTEELRYLALSSKPEVDVVDYPDSGQFAVAAGIKNADFKTATFKYMGREAPSDPAEYWK